MRALLLLLLLDASSLLVGGVKVPLASAGKHHPGAAGLKSPWHRWRLENPIQQQHVVGMRIPRRYFVTKGFGETDQGAGADPFETGAHDLGMEQAGIHNFNLMTYTSILPWEAEEIPFEEAQKYFHHGSALECILAEMHGGKGDRVTAGVGRMMVGDRAANGARMGGFAVEYEGGASEEGARGQLDEALDALFDRRFTATDHSKEDKVFDIVCVCYSHPAT
ncbi:hypothetical protein ABPG75_008328 [Micractinium tetrahymenae]